MTDPGPDKETATLKLWPAVLTVAFFAAFLPVWGSLINAWYTLEDCSHGFVILPVCIYIAWRKKALLLNTPIIPSNRGLALSVFSLMLYVLAYKGAIETVASLSMILAVVGIIIYLYGFAVVRELAFPLALLLFMVPVPAQIYASLTSPLQLLVTRISVWGAGMSGIPVLREGNIINLPSKSFEIVEACSGLRSMVSLSLLAALVGYFTLKSNLLRTVVFLFAAPVAVVINIARITLVLLSFHFLKIDLSSQQYHSYFGYLIFFVAFALIFLLSEVLSRWDRIASAE